MTADGLEHRHVEAGGTVEGCGEAGAARSRVVPQCLCGDGFTDVGADLGEPARGGVAGDTQCVRQCCGINLLSEMQVEQADVARTEHGGGSGRDVDAVAARGTVGARWIPSVRREMVQ